MGVLVILLALNVAAVIAVPADTQRIVGGSLTTIQNYPSIVALLYSSNLISWRHACGGSIINTRNILTAAHCVYGDAPIRWRVRYGSSYANSGGSVITSQRITIHNKYNTKTKDNDVAIIRTASNIVYSNNARAASFASSNYNLGDNKIVWAAGWGRVANGGALSEQLRHVQVYTINQAACQQRYNPLRRTITANMLCSGILDVGGRDQCQGDSGGPLYQVRVVVGVTSWGEGCADRRYPGVNARVSRLSPWIVSNAI